MKFLTSIVFIFLIMCQSVQSAEYYVATVGNDGNAGTFELPWLTIGKATGTLVAGDTAYVLGGTYNANIISMTQSGTSGFPITFKNYQADVVTIDGRTQGQWAVVDWISDHDYIIWDGLNVTGGSNVGVRVQGDYNIIRNCTIYDTAPAIYAGLLIAEGDYNSVNNNVIYGNYNGVTIKDCNYTEIEYNTIFDADHTGIDFLPDASRDPQILWYGNNAKHNTVFGTNRGIYSRYQRDNEYSNNLIHTSGATGFSFADHPSLPPSTHVGNTKIYNNTIVGSTTNGIENFAATGLIFENNLIDSSGNYDLYMASGTGTGHTINYNMYSNTTIFVGYDGSNYSSLSAFQGTGQEANGHDEDAQFAGSYALLEGSPGIDDGVDLTSEGITDDIVGISRPQNSIFDIGAFEFETEVAASYTAEGIGLDGAQLN